MLALTNDASVKLQDHACCLREVQLNAAAC